ncbi:MAG: hypothetical protein CO001_01875 [Candidatus Portnoybacteria bacterium CG_4_8_14_3_um_filter_40_10]|uniref:HTH deoR-type domain-containing protein n=4 Tax=Candidatus Portnoyibacteriota TaxID=1817913 RepID=A0A2M7IIH9_9BACT|nr:MAG: hypothetical protein COV84_00235 [Candidatus Portnoybacteria bacterium CG11_big_fil_rev_8_21_14_0_20_40_15]PIW76337.1 MAG: hypothetical protein CO001_01875 [Candidatus Portnoybacteria bacterium CG_4_8_14_3_um_filter_40_10]PIY75321.1 MAG: hypothetical protein COY85_00570 [Candidatus Portnoybacteria bacterium CG_4_10_14_0_8_um_filter_40_50]PJA64425.1 MAG: hypothetical protein CO159_03095 [Candidatus Portnoybacteria bacterium CG_4_9_14_3_um_filter_40_10]
MVIGWDCLPSGDVPKGRLRRPARCGAPRNDTLSMNENGSENLTNFKRRAFELCLAVYRVTNLFPRGEALCYELRQSSSKTVVLLATGRIRDTILKTEEVKIYLEIAKNQKWLAPINFDLLKNAYSLMADGLPQQGMGNGNKGEKIVTTPLPKIKKEKEERFIFGEAQRRQETIVDYFNKNREAKLADLLNVLGSISERTIRNDLAELIDRNFIRKVGSRKDARYLLSDTDTRIPPR